MNTLEVADRVATQNQEHAAAVAATHAPPVTSTSKAMPPPPVPASAMPTPKAVKKQPAHTERAPETPTKPMIKLRLGGSQAPSPAPSHPPEPKVQSTVATEEHKAIKLKPPKPPRAKKAKESKDMPPPPYIDDGSHDLLQEVIAMEELEKGGGSGRASSSKHSNVKTRKVINLDLDADDELLSLAMDDKRPEKPPVRHSEPEKVEPTPTPPPAPPPIKIPQISKSKKPVEPTPVPPKPMPSTKGKEKEVAPPAPVVTQTPPKQIKKASTPAHAPPVLVPINERKCRDILKILMKLPQAVIFNRPVDPVHDGCPT